MAITVTAAYAAITVGSTPSMASNAYKLALQAATTVYSLHATYTNGARQHNEQKFVKVWHTVSAFSITAAAALLQLRLQAEHFDLYPVDQISSAVTIIKSDMQQADGGFLYIWLEEPTLNLPATLSLSVLEM